MRLNVTDAFVLRTYKLAEADKIVVLLTQRFGLLRGVARGARRLKSRFGASLEPFTLVSLTYHEKEARELVSISQAEIVNSYFHLARNAEVTAALNYLSELLVEFTPPHAPDEKLFRMVRASLDAMDSAPADAAEITRYFEIWLLKLSGFLPDARACATCRRALAGQSFLGAGGALQCASCAQGGGLTLSAEALAALGTALRVAPKPWVEKTRTLAPTPRQELGQLTRRLIARALERIPRTQDGAR